MAPEPSTPAPVDEDRPAPAPLAAALFLLSTATVLFTLSIFKLLSFFIMPSLFFDLLFIGFPLGAIAGVKLFRPTLASFRRTLWVLQAVMLLSVLAALACKHFDYLRAHLFEVRLHRLIAQMGTFTCLFLPFFCAYGLSEYVGYQVGRRHLSGRMPLVYALYLFGAAFAYVFVKVGLAPLGISRLLGLAVLLVAVAAVLLSSPGRSRWLLGAEALVLLAALVVPVLDIEERFLELYKGRGPQSTHDYRVNQGYEPRFQKWGSYSLTEVLYSESRKEFAGFYNDLMQWEYAPRYGFTERSLGMVPINITPRGGRIAIVGSGGGRQVKWALDPRFDFAEILALELEPAVFEAVRSRLRDEFGQVYEQPNVRAVRREARSYMEDSTEAFDLIYMPSVGGYPQMMLEPGNMIRTLDAYRTLRDRLSDRGVLAIWYPAGLDPKGVLTYQYVRSLRFSELGMNVEAYANAQEFLILAARSPETRLPSCQEVDRFLRNTEDAGLTLPPNVDAGCYPFFVLPDPKFKPISDEQPFLAGNVRHIFSLGQVYALFGLGGGVLAAAGGALLLLLRRRGDPGIRSRTYWEVAGLSLLIGANFLVFEHYVILALFRKQYVFYDALVLGAISFLVLSGLGSILITARLRPLFQLAGGAFVVALLFLEPQLPAFAVLACVAPVAFVTGSFFPALFERAAHNPLVVFAMDAVGAAFGSAAAFFVPIAFGFRSFFVLGAVVFLATAASTHLFFRGLEAQEPRDGA
jgi:hypothetical protein